jgi:cytochrome c biogenesis protein CcmG, thiol:disulfide interchange protein DsbE
MNRLWYAVPVLIFAGISAGLALSLTNDPSKLPSMLLDKRAPSFSLPGLHDGQRGLSSNDLGKKVSLINVFASWCGSCRIEHSALMALGTRSDIALYGIDWKDDPGRGAGWLKTFQNPYRLVGDDRSGRVAIDFGVTGVPETFLVDTTGRIRYRHAGPITDGIWKETFEPIIAKIQAEQ